MSHLRFLNLKCLSFFCLLFALSFLNLKAADSDAATAPAAQPGESAGSNESLRAYLQLQEQLHAAQLSIDRNRQESQAAAAQNSQTLSNQLQAMQQSLQQSLLAQRADELQDAQRTNHLLLVIVGLFAIIGFAAGLFTAYFQWRALSRLAEISTALPVARGLPGLASTAIGLGEPALSEGAAAQSNSRVTSLIEHLEKRIAELEHATMPPLKELPASGSGTFAAAQPVPDNSPTDKSAQIASLLEQGQSLLNADRTEEALVCFDHALELAPDHAEALVKKGAALEKMRQPQEALECYDRAINADSSMTIAYLHKGGLCNRLERYSEAMECYEQALHTQEKKRAA
jgi:tetratricopeptide (TPR) repeat protein